MATAWPDTRHEVAYEEARAVIESQNDTMADIDDKAMRTVRLNTLLIGILLAATEATEASMFDPFVLKISIGGLVRSTVAGLLTYTESDLYVGPRGEYIERLVAGDTVSPWSEDLLLTFAGMIAENAEEIVRNSRLLSATQFFLVVGILAAMASIGF